MGDDSVDANRSAANISALKGSHAGRGFRFQDSTTTALAMLPLADGANWLITPEGQEDVSINTGETTIEVQIRSRRFHRGSVPTGEFVAWMADLWNRHGRACRADRSVFLMLVAEQPVEGIAATGLHVTLNAVDDGTTEQMLAERIGTEDAELAMSRTFLIIEANPLSTGCGLLADHLGVEMAVAEFVFLSVSHFLGDLASLRGAPGLSPTSISGAELEEQFTVALESIDLDAIHEAVSGGYCSPVSFRDPVFDRSFYRGVDVVPGHVVAGLVHDRPSEVEAVRATLESHRHALVAGPSGIGKSAIAWLTAYQNSPFNPLAAS